MPIDFFCQGLPIAVTRNLFNIEACGSVKILLSPAGFFADLGASIGRRVDKDQHRTRL